MDGTAPLTADPGQKQDWRDRVAAALDGQFEHLAHTINPEAGAGELHFELVSERLDSLAMKVSVGDKNAFLKVFDGSAAKTQTRYTREKQTLMLMHNSGLTVRLLAYCDPLRFLLTRYEKRATENRARQASNAIRFPREIGEWTAHFDAFAPNKPAPGNWYNYLKRFGDDLKQEVVSDARDILVDIPLLGAALSRNDPSFSNYMVDDDGALIGCDFEAARMRPRGWDYLLAYQAVIENAGEDTAEALNALSAGFAHKHRGALLVDELNTVARVLFCARALAVGRGERLESDPWQ